MLFISGRQRLGVRVWRGGAGPDSRIRVPGTPLTARRWRRARPWRRSRRPVAKSVRTGGVGVASRPRDQTLVIERREGESALVAPGPRRVRGRRRRSRAAAMGLGSSTEQPAETSEGFHLHGVSRSRGAGGPGAGRPHRRAGTPWRRLQGGGGGDPALVRRPGWRARPPGRGERPARGGPAAVLAPARLRPLAARRPPSASCAGSGRVSWSGRAAGSSPSPGRRLQQLQAGRVGARRSPV